MRPDLLFATLLACAAAAGCGPPDGVLSYTFALVPATSIKLPDGFGLREIAYASASGRVTGVPPRQKLGFTITGLPPLGVPPERAYYRFSLVLLSKPMSPLASLPSRVLRALAPIGTAWAHGEGGEVDLGHFDTDALGSVTMNPDPENFALDRTDGARIDIAVPVPGAVLSYKVMEGFAGNLQDTTGGAAVTTTGHVH